MSQASIVPGFFLFGEPVRTVEGKFVHLESLDDRSRPNDWNIRPHAHADLNHIFHLTTGAGVMQADGRSIAFAAPCLVLVPSGVVHGFKYEAESTGLVLTIADSYLRELCAREPDLRQVFAGPAHGALAADTTVSASLATLARELNWTAPGRSAAVEACLMTILVEALRLASAQRRDPATVGVQAGLVARYRALIDLHYKDGLSPGDYAARLGVSLKQLRGACASVTGATLTELIVDRVMLEAKRALVYSNMSVAEVGFHLGFDDPSYFTRFFKRGEGISPRQYRARAAADTPFGR